MILGITGSFGCGKSAVLSIFAARNWRTADADRICHELYDAPPPELTAALRGRWAERPFDTSGRIERSKLAGIVFADPVELEALTALVYPLLNRKLDDFIACCRRDDADAAIEIPLLYETGFENKFDRTVAVWAAPELRRRRLCERRHFTPENIADRERRQLAPDLKLERADAGLINNGTRAELERQIDRLINQLKVR